MSFKCVILLGKTRTGKSWKSLCGCRGKAFSCLSCEIKPRKWKEYGMGRTIAIANQKGGVGKTTTAINLSACLAEAGQRVLAIDFDPQGNATTGLGLEKEQIEDTVYELLLGDCTLEDCLMRDVQENLDVLPSDSNLAGAEIELLDVENKESVLNGYLETIRDQYDFIIIDCPPSLSLLTTMRW